MADLNSSKNWRDLFRPHGLVIDSDSLSSTYGKFTAAPLERGFGLTLGNSLRRVLLSSLQGAAITTVRIDGVDHEFGTIPDVQEDVTDIILNLKEVLIRLDTIEERSLRIEATGPRTVTAGDIIHDSAVEILNPNHVILTLAEGAKVVMEMTCRRGRGYQPADSSKKDGQPIGTIPIDALFSPITKVNYNVTSARVGQRTDYDRLVLEVWSDGSVSPDDATAFAAKIIKEQMNVFINFDETDEPAVFPEPELVGDQNEVNEHLYRSVDELELSVRSANCLQNANIKTIADLVQKTEADMLQTKNFGRKSLKEIKEILSEMGLSLGMKIDNLPVQAPAAVS